jgi:hypothetical protein
MYRDELADAEHSHVRPAAFVGGDQKERQAFAARYIGTVQQLSQRIGQLIANRSGHD